MTGRDLQSGLSWQGYLAALKEGQAMNERRIARIAAEGKERQRAVVRETLTAR